MTKALGKITFTVDAEGEMFIRQQWNPQDMPKVMRAMIARELHKTAANMLEDKFENDGEFINYESPAEAE